MGTLIVTGYGRAALAALEGVVEGAKTGDPLAPVTVLVPDQLAGVTVRRRLAVARSGVAGLTVTTLSRLAEQLAGADLAPRLPTTRAALAAAWRVALTDDPGLFAEVARHPATIRALARAHRQLRDLGPAGLAAVGRSGPLGADVARLHGEVVRILGARWHDQADLLAAAAGRLAARPETARPLGLVVLYLPQDLTNRELALAAAIEAATPLTVVAGLTGVAEADLAVRGALARIGLTPAEPASWSEPVAPARAAEVLHASDADDEVRCVVRRVLAALAETPAHRIAVLHAGAVPYARLLHEHLGAAGVTVNGPGIRSVRDRALARGFVGLLELARRDVPRAELFAALSQAPVRLAGGRSAPLARWERASREAGVVGGPDWDARLSLAIGERERRVAAELGAPEPDRERAERHQRGIENLQQLRQFALDLRARLAAGRGLADWAALSEWALELFYACYGAPAELSRLPAAEQYAAVAIEQSLRAAAGLGQIQPAADLETLIEVLDLDLEAAHPRVGRFGEGVFVGPVAAAVGLDLDVSFVVGLAEDAYPGRVSPDPLLPEATRLATGGAAGGELPSSLEVVRAQHRQLLAALAGAGVAVASFPRGDLRRSTPRRPSRWLLPTLRRLAGDPQLMATSWDRQPVPGVTSSRSFWEELRSTAAPATEQEWRVRAVSAGARLRDPVMDAAGALLEARLGPAFTRYDGNLAGVAGLPDYAHAAGPVSPTALEAFADCPHRFFVQRLLGVSPVEQPEEVVTISPADIGTIVHECMDRLVKESPALPGFGQPWPPEARGRLARIAAEVARDAQAHGLTGHPLLWERERERLVVDLLWMLDDDDSHRKARDARVLGSELRFGHDGHEPVAVPVAGGAVRMSGSADKVDETRDGVLLVTDIKTGSARSFRAIEADPVAGGTKLQLPVYAHAARRAYGGRATEAMYWFVRRDAGARIVVPLDQPTEQLYAETLATITASIAAGLFPAKAPEAPDFAWVRCAWCNPDGLGHGEQRARYERKRGAPELAELVALIDAGAVAGP